MKTIQEIKEELKLRLWEARNHFDEERYQARKAYDEALARVEDWADRN